jgi:DNA-binding MarR family transcriptional regulator
VAHTDKATNGRSEAATEESLLYELVDLGFRLANRTNALVDDVLRELGLTIPLANAMWKLDPGKAAPSMGELARRIGCDPSTVTGLADRLEERDLIERVVNPANRRSSFLVLTPEGLRVRGKLVEAMATRSPVARLSKTEQRQLHRLLSQAMRNSAELGRDKPGARVEGSASAGRTA